MTKETWKALSIKEFNALSINIRNEFNTAYGLPDTLHAERYQRIKTMQGHDWKVRNHLTSN